MNNEISNNFIKDLKWSIEETARKNDYKPSKKYKPSSLKCIRNMYYQRTGADLDPPTPSYILEGICNSGTDIHIRVQQAVEQMQKNNINCEYVDVGNYIEEHKIPDVKVLGKTEMETRLGYDPLFMTFMADGIIKYNDQYYILEIKTETDNKWKTTFDVLEEHKDQARAYSLVLGLDTVVFLYVNRSNLDLKSFIYTPTEEEKLELKNKILTCEQFVEKGKTPSKPRSNVACDYCRYKQRCSAE